MQVGPDCVPSSKEETGQEKKKQAPKRRHEDRNGY